MTDGAKKFIEGLDKNEATKDVPWNGREIRNGPSPVPEKNILESSANPVQPYKPPLPLPATRQIKKPRSWVRNAGKSSSARIISKLWSLDEGHLLSIGKVFGTRMKMLGPTLKGIERCRIGRNDDYSV